MWSQVLESTCNRVLGKSAERIFRSSNGNFSASNLWSSSSDQTKSGSLESSSSHYSTSLPPQQSYSAPEAGYVSPDPYLVGGSDRNGNHHHNHNHKARQKLKLSMASFPFSTRIALTNQECFLLIFCNIVGSLIDRYAVSIVQTKSSDQIGLKGFLSYYLCFFELHIGISRLGESVCAVLWPVSVIRQYRINRITSGKTATESSVITIEVGR